MSASGPSGPLVLNVEGSGFFISEGSAFPDQLATYCAIRTSIEIHHSH